MQCQPKIITIDAAGTLIRPWPSVGAVYGEAARNYGLVVVDAEIDRRFYKVFGEMQKDRKITSGEEKDFWKQVVLCVFEPYSKNRPLHELFERLWDLFALGEHWKLSEGAKETLNALRQRGYRLAVLSNNDSRLRSVLHDLEIDDLFDEIFISSELGVEKPDVEIFRIAERILNGKPSDFLHLGDSYSRDFEGARNAGWSALLFGKPKIEEEQILAFPELIELLP